MIFKRTNLLAGAALCLMLAGCTPTIDQRGNLLELEQVQRVEAGKHRRSDVLRLIGSPTTVAPFDDNTWYYIGQKTQKRGILDPQVTNEAVFIVTFGDDGVVESIRERDGERIDVPIARDATPTKGNDSTIMQEFFGNLGKFNPNTN
jgi:outer membrane protein assembly factor BamE (lipoprotein component of BamABCDE complex)